MTNWETARAALIAHLHESFDECLVESLESMQATCWALQRHPRDWEQDPPAETLRLFAAATEAAQFTSSAALGDLWRGIESLERFCRAKAKAFHYRATGKIVPATRLEGAAERAYNELPKDWRW